MIEPTDEMLRALLGRSAHRGLEALLAIVERDYTIRPRRRPPAEDPRCGQRRRGMECELPPGHPGNHGRSLWEAWA